MCRAGTWSGTFAAVAFLVMLQVVWTGIGLRNGACSIIMADPDPFWDWHPFWAFLPLWIMLALVAILSLAVLFRFFRLTDAPEDDMEHSRAIAQGPAALAGALVVIALSVVLVLVADTARNRCAALVAYWGVPLGVLAGLIYAIVIAFLVTTFGTRKSLSWLFVCCGLDAVHTAETAPACFGLGYAGLDSPLKETHVLVHIHNASVALLGVFVATAFIVLAVFLDSGTAALHTVAWLAGIGLAVYAAATIVVIIAACSERGRVYNAYSQHVLLLSLVLVAGLFVTAFYLPAITAATALSTATWFIVALVLVMIAFWLLPNPTSPRATSGEKKVLLPPGDDEAVPATGAGFSKNVLVNW